MTTDLAAGPDPVGAEPVGPDPVVSGASAGSPAPAASGVPAERWRRWLPLVAAAVTMVLWASAFVVIRALSGAVAPGPLALGRLLVGSLVLTAVALLRPGRKRIAVPRGRPLLLIIAYGVLWFGVYTVAVNAAGRYLDAGTSAMLVNLAPVVVAVLAGIFLGEGFPRQLMLGLLIAFAGVVIIASASRTGQVDPLGVALALAAAGLYAVGVLLQKQALATVDPVTVTWLGALAGTLATLPFVGSLVTQLRAEPWSVTAGVVYLGVFPTAVAFLLWGYALARTSAGRMAASSYVVPGIAVLLSWALLSEVPATVALVGGAVSLAGVALTRLPLGARSRADRSRADRARGHRSRGRH
jgi:drug/metabolite transporter (DMT)-like permease